MPQNKTPMIIGLVVLIIAVVGVLVYEFRGSLPGAANDQQFQQNIKRQMHGDPGFTPAPR